MDDPKRSFRPELETSSLDEFRVTGEVDIRTVLRRLRDEGSPIGLFVDSPSSVTSQVIEIEPSFLDLEIGLDDGFSTGNRGWQRVITADEILCVAFVDGVKVQFRGRHEVVHVSGEQRLRMPLPSHIYRIQRREGYRVRPLHDDPVTCLVSLPEGSHKLDVLDFSVVGLALHFPRRLSPPSVGALLRDVRLRLPGPRILPCTLSVRRIAPHPGEEGFQVGCAYERLPPETARAVQRLVREVEQARRVR